MNPIMRWDPLLRWDPFRELEQIQEKMASLLGHSPVQLKGNGEETLKVSEWSPLVDISEDEKEYLVKTELPEIKKEDVKVSVDEGVLSITGERKFEKEEKGRKYHRMERAYGSFVRRFTLPDDATSTKVSAEFRDGVLKVHLPKSPQQKPKEVEVKVA